MSKFIDIIGNFRKEVKMNMIIQSLTNFLQECVWVSLGIIGNIILRVKELALLSIIGSFLPEVIRIQCY